MSRLLKKAQHFYCGTSNVVLPVPNKGHFPPEYQDQSRLHYYATLFNSVEINSSFYKIPMQRTVEKWADDVPDNFRFTFKLWRGITHEKELAYEAMHIERFLHSVNAVGNKKGCLLVQFPASIKLSYFLKLKRLLGELQEADIDGWNLSVEFRDKSWHNDIVYELLEQYRANVVVHDMPKSATPWIDMDVNCVYLRFHGQKGDYRGGYPDDILLEYATDIRRWLAQKKDVYAYFNNTMGDAVHNAIALNRLLK